MTTPELFQFQFSHYNEKARWALDLKGVAHVRRHLLPGPHQGPMKRLTGQTQVPALRVGDQVITGSAAIIDHLEHSHPEPALYPADEAERRRALEIQDWFDEEVGPHVRRALFFDLLPEAGYLARMFSTGRGALARNAYRLTMPAVVPIMRRAMQIDAERAAESRERTREGLDFVVKHAGPDGYLVGSRFSVADLTAASLLMLTAYPAEIHPPLPEPRSKTLLAWLARWADHPGTAWVADMYKRHRGASAEIAA